MREDGQKYVYIPCIIFLAEHSYRQELKQRCAKGGHLVGSGEKNEPGVVEAGVYMLLYEETRRLAWFEFQVALNHREPSMKIVRETRQRCAKGWNWRWWANSDGFRHIVSHGLLVSLRSLLAWWRGPVFISTLALLSSWLLLLFIITIVTAATIASAVAKTTSVSTSTDGCVTISIGCSFE